MELLRTEQLVKKFNKNGQTITAVDHVSFSVNEGECLGLVGESGCGKSTTARLIARLIREDGGDIFFAGKKISGSLRLKPVGRELQMIFQNPQDSFDPRDTLLASVMQGAASFQMFDRRELEERALQLLSYVGLKEECKNRRTVELSGGECQRAAIARALICGPRLLICDEATSALDVLVQAQIIDLLKKLKSDGNMSMLFITHDLPLASVICDRICVMHRGKLVEEGKSPCELMEKSV